MNREDAKKIWRRKARKTFIREMLAMAAEHNLSYSSNKRSWQRYIIKVLVARR